jgi:hypothetical protein
LDLLLDPIERRLDEIAAELAKIRSEIILDRRLKPKAA